MMAMRAAALLVIWGLLAGPVAAQQMKILSYPNVGEEATAPAGGELYSFARMYTVDGAKLDARTKAGDWLLEKWYEAGTGLVPVDTKSKFKACLPFEGGFEAAGPCFLDDDGDGKFDRQARDDFTMARKLKAPVPYTLTPISVVRQDTFKRVFLFQGATADALRFSYREFSNDIARPAFTEDLVIPREAYPAMVRLKNLQIEVLGVNGLGLTYRVVKAD